MILGIDTSTDQCAVALVDGDRSWKKGAAMERGHAEALFPMIEAVLDAAGVRLAQVDRIAVCTGPGSFTGIRAGVAAARGLALGLGVPAVAVDRVEALTREWDQPVAVRLKGDGVAVVDGGVVCTTTVLELAPGVLLLEGAKARPDAETVARLGLAKPTNQRPAPVYLRPADATPSSVPPPRMLD